MKKLTVILFITAAFISFYSCGSKKEENKENYVNPAFKENLSEVYQMVIKRYSIDRLELEKKFGLPGRIEIDSVQSQVNERVFDSTMVYTFKNVVFHYYKRSYDKRTFQTEIDISAELRTKEFTLQLNAPKEEFINLFGEALRYEAKENTEELSYSIYKDEEGVYYDTITFIFVDDKYVGMRYVPYLEIYPSNNQEGETSQQ